MRGGFPILILLHSSTALVHNRRCQRSFEDGHHGYEEVVDEAEGDANDLHSDPSNLLMIETWPESNTPGCGIAPSWNDTGSVYSWNDGVRERCISVITPRNAVTPMPVLFWFHGTGGKASACPKVGPGDELVTLAEREGFAIVCAEAMQIDDISSTWALPEIQTTETGTRCENADSPEVDYVHRAIWKLLEAKGKEGEVLYAHSKIFFAGVSNGAAMAEYSAACWKQKEPHAVSAFAAHSTGLKQKGDGVDSIAKSPYSGVQYGECDGCQYFPIVPTAYEGDELGLKACIFMGNLDYLSKTAEPLQQSWVDHGNREQLVWYSDLKHEDGVYSFEDIITCLDDNTGRLMSSHATPAPAPTPA